MPDGRPWPRISIVTPSFQQGQFIEETIRSVLLQRYPNLEYVIIDGGSSDDSLEIIRKYEPWLSDWVSEPDRGQTHAINKGLSRCSGEICNWLNSDDQLAPDALAIVAKDWARHDPEMLVGEAVFLDAVSRRPVEHWCAQPPRKPSDFIAIPGLRMAQPATFLSRALIDTLGPFREDLHCIMDYEFYLRACLKRGGALRSCATDHVLAHILQHPASKSSALGPVFVSEWRQVLGQHFADGSAAEQQLVARYLRQSERQVRVLQSTSLGQLAAVGLSRPDALLSRFYWGAVRRRLFSGRDAG
jgi:glycosyltransferase involved in cell wall biosynthesis